VVASVTFIDAADGYVVHHAVVFTVLPAAGAFEDAGGAVGCLPLSRKSDLNVPRRSGGWWVLAAGGSDRSRGLLTSVVTAAVVLVLLPVRELVLWCDG